jgi:hypothetical protein
MTSNNQSRASLVGSGSRKDLQPIELAGSQARSIAVGRIDQHAPLDVENAPASSDLGEFYLSK